MRFSARKRFRVFTVAGFRSHYCWECQAIWDMALDIPIVNGACTSVERFDDQLDIHTCDWCLTDDIGYLCDACAFRQRPPHYGYVEMIFNNTKLSEAPDVANLIACFAYLVCYKDSLPVPFQCAVDPHSPEL